LHIDEDLKLFKGKFLHLKVYAPDKPYKWGLKSYVLVDDTSHYTMNEI